MTSNTSQQNIPSTSLDFSYGKITEKSLNETIINLNLKNTWVNVEQLIIISKLPNLKSLNVSNNDINIEGIEIISKMCLTSLDISYNNMDIEGVKLISTMNNLISLNISSNPRITEGILDIYKLPNLKSLSVSRLHNSDLRMISKMRLTSLECEIIHRSQAIIVSNMISLTRLIISYHCKMDYNELIGYYFKMENLTSLTLPLRLKSIVVVEQYLLNNYNLFEIKWLRGINMVGNNNSDIICDLLKRNRNMNNYKRLMAVLTCEILLKHHPIKTSIDSLTYLMFPENIKSVNISEFVKTEYGTFNNHSKVSIY